METRIEEQGLEEAEMCWRSSHDLTTVGRHASYRRQVALDGFYDYSGPYGELAGQVVR